MSECRHALAATQREPDEHYGIQTDVQRPLYRQHCMDLARYFKEADNWIIAPFVFTSSTDNLNLQDGKFTDFKGDFQVLDGQHRIQALHIAAGELNISDSTSDQERLRGLKRSYIALQHIENFGVSDTAQLFVDLNKAKRVSPSELAYLDGRDPVVNIIRAALDKVEWVKQHTDTARPNPAPDSGDIWTVSSLKTTVKALEVGVKTAMPRARRTRLSTEVGKEESVSDLAAFLDWLPDARKEYKNLRDDDNLDVANERTRHYAYDPKSISLLAETWANSNRTGPPPSDVAAAINIMNITRQDAACDLNKALNLLDEKGRMRAFSRADYSGASAKIREEARRRPSTNHD